MDRLRGDVANGRWGLWIALSAFALSACGGSNSEVGAQSGGAGGISSGAGGTTGSGGSPDAASGAGGSTAGSGGSAGSSGAAGAGGAVGTGGTANPNVDSGGACPALTSMTLAVHQILQVSWPTTLGANGGTGVAHIWNRTKLAVSGGSASGDETVGCGIALPSFALGAGAILTGPGMIEVDVPDAAWDLPTMPKFHEAGTFAGFDVGSAVHIQPTVALIGLTMTDPLAAWPASYTGVTAKVDADGDGKDGFTATPRTGTGFVNPPTGIGQPAADRLYLVSRNVIGLDGAFTACDTISGTAQVMFFDNHVVGCRTTAGADCTVNGTNSQTAFVDTNRTVYTVTSATFTAKKVADAATCADVRAALPR
jgi:hypothetical protein